MPSMDPEFRHCIEPFSKRDLMYRNDGNEEDSKIVP